jgi:hypothetical protein
LAEGSEIGPSNVSSTLRRVQREPSLQLDAPLPSEGALPKRTLFAALDDETLTRGRSLRRSPSGTPQGVRWC